MLRWRLCGPSGGCDLRRLLLGVICLAYLCNAQPQSSRPKIGVALGGGGALGFAHIGVLQWLEEQHIPVDYVAGTSIGGLVAGFYATGLRPAEMQDIVVNADWGDLLRTRPSFTQLPFRRKQDLRDFPSTLEVGLKNGVVRGPSGLNPADAVLLLFSRVTLPYSGLRSFDELPIPFRCIATDLQNAREVVLQGGSLPQALRATMSIPGLFTPVERDGHILVDGSLVNNLPVEQLRRMGADIIIAVTLQPPAPTAADLEAVFPILQQSIEVAVLQNERRNLQLADIVLNPDVDGFSITNFNQAKPLIERGYAGAKRKEPILRGLALSDSGWQAHLAARNSRRLPAVKPEFVEVRGVPDRQANAIAKRLSNQPLANLETNIAKIVGAGIYQNAWYEQTQRSGQNGIAVTFQQRSYGPPYVLLSTAIDASEVQNVRYGLKARINGYIGPNSAEWRGDFQIGFRSLAVGEYYQPLGNNWFFAPQVAYHRDRTYLYENRNRLTEVRLERVGSTFAIGRQFGRFAELRAGYELAHVSLGARPFLPVSDHDGVQHRIPVRLIYNRQDRPLIPTRGLRLEVNHQAALADPNARGTYQTTTAEASQYLSLSDRQTLFVTGRFGTGYGERLPIYDQFVLGGPLSLGAYRLDELRGDRMAYTSAGYLYRIRRLPLLIGGNAYAGAWYEAGSTFGGSPVAQSGTAGMLLETRLGVLFVGGSGGEGGRHRVYFTLGRFF